MKQLLSVRWVKRSPYIRQPLYCNYGSLFKIAEIEFQLDIFEMKYSKLVFELGTLALLSGLVLGRLSGCSSAIDLSGSKWIMEMGECQNILMFEPGNSYQEELRCEIDDLFSGTYVVSGNEVVLEQISSTHDKSLPEGSRHRAEHKMYRYRRNETHLVMTGVKHWSPLNDWPEEWEPIESKIAYHRQ